MEWELEVTYPDPFAGFLALFSFVKLSFGNDSKFLPMGCINSDYDFLGSLTVTCIGPIIVVLVIGLVTMATKAYTAGKYAVVVLSFCVLPQCATTIFRIFSCTTFDEEDTYLNADYSVPCSGGAYDGAVGFAVIMILMCVCGTRYGDPVCIVIACV